ncbi:hypothetical protein KI809_08365 [Geobacter pelophilus]|uniref:Uncharacterized protein n=1 Tax=Geoanaerobacter pelophilus TaxID=60036 RepID=A0AAW4L5M3_9BACT|nr:hypothetical protein [Geoanaerobacter pelophilus]MBT0664313.1 hypothetical protein [Geoanaerobacter pelophilus]
MKIFRATENVFNAVDAVVKHGFAAVDGTKSEAVPFCNRIIAALEPYNEIEPIIGYENVPNQGYLYYVFDSQKFPCGDKHLKDKIHEVDRANPV